MAYNSMLYGDKAAATGLKLAKLKTATMARHIDPGVADQIASKVYVDDGALAIASKAGLMEMRGTRLPDGSYTGKISQILEVTGMKPKFVAIPKRATPEEVEMVGG